MNISPLDIRKQTFRTVFRGADNEEVRVFLDLVATEHERLIELNNQLNERVHHCEDRLAEYREIDHTLRSSVLSAERHAAEARENAQREANLMMQEAEWRAKQMLEDSRERLNRLLEEIRDLQAKKDAYVQHLRSFLAAQSELLEHHDSYLQGVERLAEETAVLASRVRRAEVRPPLAMERPPQAQVGQAAADEPVIPPPASPRGSGFDQTQPQPRTPQASTYGQAPAPERPPQAPAQFPPTGRAMPPGPGFPPPRGLSRFGRPAPPPGSRETGAPREMSSEDSQGGRSIPERSEGLFEISADEDEAPRP